MRRRKTVDQRDYARILYTEVLPFELPLVFSNAKLAEYFRKLPLTQPPLVKEILGLGRQADAWTIPFSYKVRKGDSGWRLLSVIHPQVQKEFIEFYKVFDRYTLNLCQKSAFSLRQPRQVGSSYFETDFLNPTAATSDEVGDPVPSDANEQRRHASTYFYYSRYNQVWKFFDSTEFRRLEQRFRSMLRLDVANCFASIYTHSLAWAVHGKVFSKNNVRAAGFDSAFERLMRNANWGETNGILIGPEVSRIFAEVIFQGLDLEVEKKCRALGLLDGQIAIRRYVDDYFIFANQKGDLDSAQGALLEVLSAYRFAINESKTELMHSPLISGLSVARAEVADLLRDKVVDPILRAIKGETPSEDELKSARRRGAHGRADLLIQRFKAIVKTCGATYSGVCPYALGVAVRALEEATAGAKKGLGANARKRDVERSLSLLIEVVFFIYRMDSRVNTTYKLGRIVEAVLETAAALNLSAKLHEKEVVGQIVSVLQQVSEEAASSVEVSCLLTLLVNCKGGSALSERDATKLLKMAGDQIRLADYFGLITGLYFCALNPDFAALKDRIVQEALSRFAGDTKLYLQAEVALLFLDTLSCPYISDPEKRQAVSSLFLSTFRRSPTTAEISDVLDHCGPRLGFVTWSRAGGLRSLLLRTELRPAYD